MRSWPVFRSRLGFARLRIGEQEGDSVAERRGEADERKQRRNDVVDDVAGAHRDTAGRERLASDEVSDLLAC